MDYRKLQLSINVLIRDEGVMLATTVWQWVLEVAFMVIFYIHLHLTIGHNRVLDKFWILFSLLFSLALNGFYLLGDKRFQMNVRNIGISKALWKAFLQSYT